MLTEQNTPLPLVRQWSNLIPHCWESLDELTAKIRATQPSNMAAEAELYAAMSIVQAHVANGSLPVEIVHASFELLNFSAVRFGGTARLCTVLIIRWPQNLYSRLTSGTIVIICRLMCCFIRRTAVLLSPVPALLTRRLSVSSRLSCEIWIKEHLSFTFVWYTKLSVP